MCTHDNPLRVKVEVEDVCVSPSPIPRPKDYRVDDDNKALMLDEASLNSFLEAVTVESAAVAAQRSPL